ncbi:hypothetical protein G6L37_05355 [Agrobacterium rubi]|nr:hypothetical protein [Agrobacterium rubi]NTF24784.1 hypothetical protein [Agrobacterium rubi]
MAKGYLGEFEVDLATTPFKDFTPADWALRFVAAYGGFEGSHHKNWVLDQVARILKGTPVLVVEARWDRGADGIEKHLRFSTGEPSAEYHAWVDDMLGEEIDGEREYSYDVGIAP